MNQKFSFLINKLNYHNKTKIRFIEKLRYKIINIEISLEFLNYCSLNGLLPKFTYNSTTMKRNSNKIEVISLRKKRLEDELTSKIKLLDDLNRKIKIEYEFWEHEDIETTLKHTISKKLDELCLCHLNQNKKRIFKKLQKLHELQNKENIVNNDDKNQFINLSNITLSDNQKLFLNLGLNCHYMKRPNQLEKKIEIEKLMDDILQLQLKKKVVVNPMLPIELRTESSKCRGNYKSKILSEDLKRAAVELKNNPNIVIRRADKSSVYVIMNSDDYTQKLNTILDDSTKFKEIKKDPSNQIKTKLNRIISQINSAVKEIQIKPLRGEYKPGYIYGNVKNHKQNCPLRPIISQIPTATYSISKVLNDLLTPYIPNQFNLKSSKEFLDVITTTTPSNMIASLDVESLFTNVPVDATIQIIIDTVYNSPSPLPIPRLLLLQLLQICTKESPFIAPKNRIFQQIDGVTMGSPLGVLFANFYLGHVEKQIFTKYPDIKPKIYLRYIDDIFLMTDKVEHIDHLIETLQNQSVLKFTKEVEVNNELPFLDVIVHRNKSSFSTSVFIKPTNHGFCLNGISECSDAYKESTVNAYINRALTHSSTKEQLDKELIRIKNMLLNNNYKIETINKIIDYKLKNHNINNNNQKNNVINNIDNTMPNNINNNYSNDVNVVNNINDITNNKIITNTATTSEVNNSVNTNNNNTNINNTNERAIYDNNNDPINPTNKKDKIILYYRNIMSSAFKKDEQIIKSIIKRNLTTASENDKIYLRIYYKNNKTNNLIMKNSPSDNSNDPLKQHHLIYEFKCPIGECAHHNFTYIGMTTTTLSRRLTMHKQDGTIKKHFADKHHLNLERLHLDNNTKIIYKNSNYFKLKLAESILIDKKQPSLNIQQQNFTILPTHRKIAIVNVNTITDTELTNTTNNNDNDDIDNENIETIYNETNHNL